MSKARPRALLDPRLEESGLWPDFHTRFIAALANHLGEILHPHYVALVEERIYVAWEGEPIGQVFRPDVTIVHAAPDVTSMTSEAAISTVTAEPMIVPVALRDEVREPFISIRTPENELVTTIELLSMNNKRPGHEGRRTYLEKRQSVLTAGIHLVELDFLLGGERMPLARPWPRCDRAVLVVRAHRAHAGELYGFRVRDSLPTIRLPVRRGEPDRPLDLQGVLDDVWTRARYDRLIQLSASRREDGKGAR